MSSRSTRWIGLFAILSVLLLWEVVYYLGLISHVRFSHPLAVFQTFTNPDFLGRFGLMVSDVTLASLFGGTIGVGLGAIVFQSFWLTEAMIRFLRIGLWVPFLILLAVPPWPIRGVSSVLVMDVVAVSLFACHRFLIMCLTRGLSWSAVLLEVGRATILQALLFSVFSQVQDQSGWMALSFQGPEVVYAATILLVGVIFLVGWVFRSNFDRSAGSRGSIFVRELAGRNWSSLWGAGLLVMLCLILWQLFIDPLRRYLMVSPPLDVLKAGYRLLTSKPLRPYVLGQPIWENTDIAVWLLEIFAGVILGGALAFIVSNRMSAKAAFRTFMLPLLPMTHIVPILLTLSVMNWVGGYTGPWRTALGVVLLTFFPFLQFLWGVREQPLLCRVLSAADDALPFAFVAVLFGEATNAVAGLGFFVVVARAALRIDQAMAAALIAAAFFAAFSCTLRFLAKRLCFPVQK